MHGQIGQSQQASNYQPDYQRADFLEQLVAAAWFHDAKLVEKDQSLYFASSQVFPIPIIVLDRVTLIFSSTKVVALDISHKVSLVSSGGVQTCVAILVPISILAMVMVMVLVNLWTE